MEYFEFDGKDGYDLSKVVDCGQCFRFEKYGSGYRGIAFGNIIDAYQDGNRVYVSGFENKKSAEEFFGLDADYTEMKKEILGRFSDAPAMEEAIRVANGLAIMKQEKWETLISFIISQNNNIPRIKGIINNLSKKCGKNLGEGLYAFPTPCELESLGVEGLSELKTGYRAPYLYSAAKNVLCGNIDLEGMDGLDTPKLIKSLTSIYGVGPKVANCIALFGYGRLDAFPVDVWIKRALEDYFPGHTVDDFGRYGGLAQQYLFYWQIHK